MKLVVALVAGGLFGLGLVVSDMIDPARVLAFLDVASGRWDPTLAFVMAGAMLPMIAAWKLSGRMTKPVFGEGMPGPVLGRIDPSLVGGAVLFGTGWGLAGFCPGPALSAIGLGGWPVWVFVAAMVAGMLLPGIRLDHGRTERA